MEQSKKVIKEESYYLADENGNIISKNGYKYLLHRDNGPAVTFRDAHGKIIYSAYYRYNQRHRIDGPAVYLVDDRNDSEEETYWLFGTEYSKTDYESPGFVDGIIIENS